MFSWISGFSTTSNSDCYVTQARKAGRLPGSKFTCDVMNGSAMAMDMASIDSFNAHLLALCEEIGNSSINDIDLYCKPWDIGARVVKCSLPCQTKPRNFRLFRSPKDGHGDGGNFRLNTIVFSNS